MTTERWATPQEALVAAEAHVATLGPGEWLTEVHFSRNWPGGDHDYPPFWWVALRSTRVVNLGGGFHRMRNRDSDLGMVRTAFASAVARYSSIDGRDWALAESVAPER